MSKSSKIPPLDFPSAQIAVGQPWDEGNGSESSQKKDKGKGKGKGKKKETLQEREIRQRETITKLRRSLQTSVISFLGYEPIHSKDQSVGDAVRPFAMKWKMRAEAKRMRKERLLAKKWRYSSVFFKQNFGDLSNISTSAGEIGENELQDVTVSSPSDAGDEPKGNNHKGKSQKSPHTPKKRSSTSTKSRPSIASGARRSTFGGETITQEEIEEFEALSYRPIVTICWELLMAGILIWQFFTIGYADFPMGNPFFGPSESTLILFGAKYGPKMLSGEDGAWRLIASMGLTGGVLHFVWLSLLFIFMMRPLEMKFGAVRIICIHFISGMGGILVSLAFVPSHVGVGAGGCAFGYLGVLLVDLIQNWKRVNGAFKSLVSLILISVFSLSIGLLPYVDNFDHVGGLISGALAAIIFLPSVSLGVWKARLRTIMVIVLLILIAFAMWLCWFLFQTGVYVLGWCTWCRVISCVEFLVGWCKI